VPDLSHVEIFNMRAADYEGYSDWCKNDVLYEACVDPLRDMLPNVKCLDLGGGSGWIARRNATETARDWTVLDLSPAMQRFIQLPVKFVLGDAHSLPFEANEFAHIVIRSVLQFVDARRVLEGVRRVLTPRGNVVVAQKVKEGDAESLEWHKELHFLKNPTSPQDWTLPHLEEVIRGAGLRVMATKIVKERRVVDFERWVTKDGTIQHKEAERIRALIMNPPRQVSESTNQIIKDGWLMYDRTWAVCYARRETVKTSLAPTVVSMIVERKLDNGNAILLQRRKKKYEEPVYYKTWEIPQGKIEKSNLSAETISRELEDETGLRLDTISSETRIDRFTDSLAGDSGEVVQPLICVRVAGLIDFFAVAVIVSASGEPKSIDIDREYRWVLLENLQQILESDAIYPLNRPMLTAYLSARRRA
jgi:ubiquinone/menaquinone biosynthesis C-methylase UbiE/8-oxo-dGTP pyrophosphatase MutT (NUDIX family)